MSQVEALKDAMEEEMDWIVGLSSFFRGRLASVCGLEPYEIKQKCVNGGLVSIGFMRYLVLSVVEWCPWSLAVGDIEKNLRRLRDENEPLDLAMRKLHLQLQAGWPFGFSQATSGITS